MQAERKFLSSHSFPVPATGFNSSPSSAPAHCWCKNTPSVSRKPYTDPEYPLQLAHYLVLLAFPTGGSRLEPQSWQLVKAIGGISCPCKIVYDQWYKNRQKSLSFSGHISYGLSVVLVRAKPHKGYCWIVYLRYPDSVRSKLRSDERQLAFFLLIRRNIRQY